MKVKNRKNQLVEAFTDALDGVNAAPEHHRVIFENERVRVLDSLIKPGEIVPLHTHFLPSVSYVLAASDFIRYDADGKVTLDSRTADLDVRPGTVAWLQPAALHSVENIGDSEIHAISVELKD